MTFNEIQEALREVGESAVGILDIDGCEELWLVKTPGLDAEVIGEFYINHLSDKKPNGNFGKKQSYYIAPDAFDSSLPDLDLSFQLMERNDWKIKKAKIL